MADGLEEADEVLQDRHADGPSLRDLETQYNQWLLESALREAGVDVLQGELENLYHLLTGNDVSAGLRVEARSRLERHGLDPERLRADFVSYATIRTRLQEYMAVDTERESTVTPTGRKTPRSNSSREPSRSRSARSTDFGRASSCPSGASTSR